MPQLPFTDFEIIVEQVIRDDGRIAQEEPIILRMPSTATAELKALTQNSDYPLSYTGDRHLFLLSPNPDGETYGFYYGPWSRLTIDADENLRVSDGRQQLLTLDDWTDAIKFADFVDRIK